MCFVTPFLLFHAVKCGKFEAYLPQLILRFIINIIVIPN